MRHSERRHRLSFESLEQKTLLAGDVVAALDAESGELSITGTNRSDRILVSSVESANTDVQQVTGGATSVLLDTDLLAAAAGLVLTGASSDVTGGVLGEGSVAFAINARDAESLPTTFEYTTDDFPGGPFAGTIEHTGSVFFDFNDTPIEVGNFTIGFDPNRIGDGTSGFFVESTTGVAGILFDTDVTGLNSATAGSLDLEVDLRVSSDFAGILGDPALTGADVGDARIVAASTDAIEELLRVQVFGRRASVNGERSVTFDAGDVESLSIDTGGRSDYVNVRNVSLAGDLGIDLGRGFANAAIVTNVDVEGSTTILGGRGLDWIQIRASELGSLGIETGAGSDLVRLIDTAIDDLFVDTGSGWDAVLIDDSEVSGEAEVLLGSGSDLLRVVDSTFEGETRFDGGRGWFDRLSISSSSIDDLEEERFRF